MKHEHKSDLTISHTKNGDYYFPNMPSHRMSKTLASGADGAKSFC